MKKLKLNIQNIEGVEILTRAQLKNVLGGTEEPGGTTEPGVKCSSSSCTAYTTDSKGNKTYHDGQCGASSSYPNGPADKCTCSASGTSTDICTA